MAVGRKNQRAVPVIVGPTASGKTALALELAVLLPIEVISADSRQVYRYLDIGTAKPSRMERERVRHHFIDVVDPDEDFNAGQFGEQGRRVIEDIFSRERVPVVVGGSGLYIRSLVDGLFEGPGADPDYRDALDERIRRGELPALIEDLRRVDPEAAVRIDPTKPRRVVRALEVFHATGKPLSTLQSEKTIEVNFTPRFYGLLWDRATMYARINARCEEMVAGGLLDEAANLEGRGYGRNLNALNTVGYKEAFACLSGEIPETEMLSMFKQNSRRYAKRQMTWFRRDERILWLRMEARDGVRQHAEIIARDTRALSET